MVIRVESKLSRNGYAVPWFNTLDVAHPHVCVESWNRADELIFNPVHRGMFYPAYLVARRGWESEW